MFDTYLEDIGRAGSDVTLRKFLNILRKLTYDILGDVTYYVVIALLGTENRVFIRGLRATEFSLTIKGAGNCYEK